MDRVANTKDERADGTVVPGGEVGCLAKSKHLCALHCTAVVHHLVAVRVGSCRLAGHAPAAVPEVDMLSGLMNPHACSK